jgi:molybdopterin-guanine dinucleotide biosynthesis adapter protein
MVLMREFERPDRVDVHDLIAGLHPGVDWVLVEGFRDCDLMKIEVWRASQAGRARPLSRRPVRRRHCHRQRPISCRSPPRARC